MAMSRLVLPLGLMPTIVLATGVNIPVALIANPEIVDVPAFEVYARLPFGVIALQQVAAPNVGTLVLIGDRVPFAATV